MHPSDNLEAASELRRLVAVSADPPPVVHCTAPCAVPRESAPESTSIPTQFGWTHCHMLFTDTTDFFTLYHSVFLPLGRDIV